MILVINICKERLHYFEFVKPIEDILKEKNIKFFTRHYKKLEEGDLMNAKSIIICGTSLYDNEFLGNYHNFDWLLDFNGKVLGICGGMQIIGMVFGNKIHTKKGLFRNKTEIGYYYEIFKKEFLGLFGENQVYHLHNNYIKFGKDFIIYSGGKCSQAVKHKNQEIYGVLFHPEVRQKAMILSFADS